MNEFHGYQVRQLSSKHIKLDCLATAGPRIVRLTFKGSANLFAEVPENRVSTPYGDFDYLGGHRLWHAPESMPRSYVPDSDGLTISEVSGGLLLDGKTEPATGIHKQMEIRLDPDRPRVTVVHSLINEGLWEVEVAPWALSMMRLGGAAVLPIRAKDGPAEGLLPNRHISLWPYTHTSDPRLHLQDDFILIEAKPGMPPFKIGAFNPQGWVAYWIDGIIFRKSFSVSPQARHPDFDCNSEIYCDSHFIELESLAPLSRLGPGARVSHTETWDLYDSLEQEFVNEDMIRLLR
jgi:hypothetical protein